MKIHEYQGEGDPRALRRAGSARRGGVLGAGSRRDRAPPRRRHRRRQGADSRRRPRQGRRRQGRRRARTRPRQVAAELLGQTLVTYQTGPGRPGGRPAADRRRPGDRSRAVPEHAGRSRVTEARDDGQRRRRRRHRRGRGQDAREDPQGVHRSRRLGCSRTRRASWRLPSASPTRRSARRPR